MNVPVSLSPMPAVVKSVYDGSKLKWCLDLMTKIKKMYYENVAWGVRILIKK